MPVIGGFLDFDGTVYGTEYCEYFYYIIHEFGYDITRLARPDLTEEEKIEARDLSEKICSFITAMELHDAYDYAETRFSVLINYCEDVGFKFSDKHLAKIQGKIFGRFRRLLDRLDKKIHNAFLIKGCKNIIDKLCEAYVLHNATAMRLYMTTSRHDYRHDLAGIAQNGTGPVFLDIQVIVDAINRRLAKNDAALPCRVSPFMLTDVYNGLKRGETFRRTVVACRKREKGQDCTDMTHPSYKFYDKCKTLMVRSQAMDLGYHFPGEDLYIHFFDDLDLVVNAMDMAFGKLSDLLSKRMKLYVHDVAKHVTKEYVGTGVQDNRYVEHVWKVLEYLELNLKSPHEVFEFTGPKYEGVWVKFLEYLHATHQDSKKLPRLTGLRLGTLFEQDEKENDPTKQPQKEVSITETCRISLAQGPT